MDSLNAPMLLAHEGTANVAADSLLQQHALGALQKLSLLRRAQSEMIRLGVVSVICSMLGDGLGRLTEYTVEYSMALLMNLSLRTAGKRSFEQCDVLSVLDALIESSNPQVRTYVNGTLYSVLQRQAIRETAQARGLGDFLQMVAANSDEVFARQIRYIQLQLGSTAPDTDGPPSCDEEEFEDIDEDGEEEGDEADSFEAEQEPVEGLLYGEELLCERYLADVSAAKAEEASVRESMALVAAAASLSRQMQGGLRGSVRGAVAASLKGEVLQRPSTPASFSSTLRSSGFPTATEPETQAADPPEEAYAPRLRSEGCASAVPSPRRSGQAASPRLRLSRGLSAGASSSREMTSREPASGVRRSSSGIATRTPQPPTARERAEREARLLRAKMQERDPDDPGGFAPLANEYAVAFGTKQQLPRTPFHDT
uniref:Lish domain-containing protein armc9-like n=1 Tax=Tetraselmis sp. GSL018 TaxID=582737 RepID=A0A061SGW0_9CHLO